MTCWQIVQWLGGDSAGSAVREQLEFEDSLVGAHHIVNSQGIPEQACHTALALTPERMLLLGSQGAAPLPPKSQCTCCPLIGWYRQCQNLCHTL